MAFELWSMASRNLIGSFATEAEALAAVRDIALVNTPAYVAGLVLGYENSRGRSRAIAQGAALVRRAQQAVPADTTPSPPTRRSASA